MTTTLTTWRASAVLVLIAASLGACTAGPDRPEPTSTSSSPRSATSSSPSGPTVDPEREAAEAQVLDAYHGYWAAKVASYADPTQPQDPNLAVFADDTALADAQSTLFTLRQSGIRIPGEPALAPVVAELVMGETPSATITDCVDSTNWQPIYAATKDSAAAPDQPTRVVAEATAFVAEGQWRIRTFVIQRDRTC